MSQKKNELKCNSCKDWYDEGLKMPKDLPCGHIICASCVMPLQEYPPMKSVTQKPQIPFGLILQCPVCNSEVRSENIQTNGPLLSKISAMIGLESMLYSDENFIAKPGMQGKSLPKQDPYGNKLKPAEKREQYFPFKTPQVPLSPQQPQQPPPHLFQHQNPQVPQDDNYLQSTNDPQPPQPMYQPHNPLPLQQGLGWATPSAPPPPDISIPQASDQTQLGWSVPGVPQCLPAHPDSFQEMPQPYGGL